MVAISAVVAIAIPPVFKSNGIILIESQKIPEQIVQTTVTGYANERVEIIKQRIMTRENLLKVIKKYNLFGKDVSKLSISEQIDTMRSSIDVSPVMGAFGRRGSAMSLVSFNLGYENRDPKTAQEVANELVTLFLDENVRTRTARAAETTEFLTDEVKKLKAELEKTEQEIVLFKRENSEALPENLALNTSVLERTESNIKASKLRIDQIRQEIRFLEIELSAAKKSPGVNTSAEIVLSPEQKLAQLELEYSELTSEFTDKHPDVRKIIREIALLKKEIAEKQSKHGIEKIQKEQGIDVARIHAKMDALNDEIKVLNSQILEQEAKRQKLEKIIIRTPQVKNALLSLTRDYDNTLRQYKEMQAKELDADLAVSLEEKEKAERFTLIEPPSKPEVPIKPNRIGIFTSGIFISLVISVGFVFLLEVSNQRIWGEDAITRILLHRPIVNIPYIETIDEMNRKKITVRNLVLIVVLIGAGILISLHFFYMSLDMIYFKILNRLGF